MDSYETLARQIEDEEIVRYFYLDTPSAQLLERLDTLHLTRTESQDIVPFNAQVKGYYGALDDEQAPWLLKPIGDTRELLYHRTCTLAYILDHWMGTLAAPTTVFNIEGNYYRATKVVQKAMQISSYNYLEHPFIDILRADLINRWLFFDEDRNPNNYLVIHNKAGNPFVCAIDYDKADLIATTMKITGNQEKFGWFRSEKTRFLTLLRPENFEGVPIEAFEERLQAMMAIPEKELEQLCITLVTNYCDDPVTYGKMLCENICARREYINCYFRQMIKTFEETKKTCTDEDYTLFGESFLSIYRGKK